MLCASSHKKAPRIRGSVLLRECTPKGANSVLLGAHTTEKKKSLRKAHTEVGGGGVVKGTHTVGGKGEDGFTSVISDKREGGIPYTMSSPIVQNVKSPVLNNMTSSLNRLARGDRGRGDRVSSPLQVKDRSLPAHYIYTIYTLYMLYIYTIYTLYTHTIHTIHTYR